MGYDFLRVNCCHRGRRWFGADPAEYAVRPDGESPPALRALEGREIQPAPFSFQPIHSGFHQGLILVWENREALVIRILSLTATMLALFIGWTTHARLLIALAQTYVT